MTIRRLSTLLGSLAFGVGLTVFGLSLFVLPSQSPAGLLLDGVLAVLAVALTVILTSIFLLRRLLRPFRELAASIAGQQALPLNRFLHSNIEEMVAVAAAIEKTESRLTSSMAQIQRDRAHMSAVFEHMADGVLVLDAYNRVELANPAALRLLRQVTIEGRPLPSVVHDPDVLHVVGAAREGSVVRHPVELRSPTGHRSWLQVVAAELPMEQRVLVLLQDVTELRHAETVRRDFVANVSHELKTPVASLKALVETLEAGALRDPECGPDFLRRMHVEVDGLAQLVAELLELARIEAGRLDLDLRVCRVDQLVGDSIERIRPYAARVGVDIRVSDIHPKLVVQVDPRQIGQVLSNLLSNAVKFTPPAGWIEVGVGRDGPLVEVWVRDSGVGIAGHDLIRVFERFYKTDPSRTGTGTGLGLAICKHVVQAHGGWICAESDGPGRGATFRFTLPAVVVETATELSDAASRAAPEYVRALQTGLSVPQGSAARIGKPGG